MKNGSICVQGNRSASPWVQLDTLCDELSCYIYFMAGCDNIFVEDKVLNIFGSFVRFSDSKAFVCLLVFLSSILDEWNNLLEGKPFHSRVQSNQVHHGFPSGTPSVIL